MAKLSDSNYRAEWMSDPLAPEIKEAVLEIESGDSVAVSSLERYARGGSTLACFLLGDIFVHGRYGQVINHGLAVHWLKKSADGGSIEGRYRLAKFYEATDLHDAAIENYTILARKHDYAPAMYILGLKLFRGYGALKDLDKGIGYLSSADRRGHLHARHWLSHIWMQSDQPLTKRLMGLWKRIQMILPFVITTIKHPNSDRIRS